MSVTLLVAIATLPFQGVAYASAASVSIDAFGALSEEDGAEYIRAAQSVHFELEQISPKSQICDVTATGQCSMTCEALIGQCRGSFLEEESADMPPKKKSSKALNASAKMAAALERNREEELKYNAQMLSAMDDKSRMFQPMFSDSLGKNPVMVVDIGPAGGAIPKALAQIALNQPGSRGISCIQVASKDDVLYVGVELNAAQVQDLNAFLQQEGTANMVNNDKASCPPGMALASAYIEQGNALELSTLMGPLTHHVESHMLGTMVGGRANKDAYYDNIQVMILESSVLHEIYSYAPCAPIVDMKNFCTVCTDRLATLLRNGYTSTVAAGGSKRFHQIPRNGFAVAPVTVDGVRRYQREVVLKNYEEALLSLKRTGGLLSIRDGVLYRRPDDEVEFVLLSQDWKDMFKLFINDIKYKKTVEEFYSTHVFKGHSAPLSALTNLADKGGGPGEKAVRLPAKIVQEFMLKANWGKEGWSNEIHEVYAYATLETHKKIVEMFADIHSIKLQITTAEEYVQCDYPKYVQGNIKILSGFGCLKKDQGKCCSFPPTNMLLKVMVERDGLAFSSLRSG